MAFKLATVCALLSLLTLQTDGYSGGAPSNACDSMTPSHGTAPQASQPPFSITAGGATVNGGETIDVTLAPVSAGGTLKGFFIQARDANTSEIVGTFSSDDHKLISCGNAINNAVTHGSSADKTQVVVKWSPPTTYSGDVVFRATAVQDYNTFWTGITSEKVTATPSTAATTTAAPSRPRGTTRRRGLLSNFRNRPTPAPPAAVTTPGRTTPARVDLSQLDPSTRPLVTALESIYLGCNANKGCFGIPAGCESKENCDAMFTYTKLGDNYQFEIMGTVDPTLQDAYVAGGLSFDDRMGEDSVVACRTFNGLVEVTQTWNEGKTNSFLADDKVGLSDYETQQADGKLYCRYNRLPRMEINNKVFDLDEDQFHIMVAKGALRSDGTLNFHFGDKLASASATSMSEFATLQAADSLFVILHACFMVAAWVGAASSGILIARYFKQTWRNYKACNIDQWFHMHRMFMILTWMLTVAGFVLIAVQLKGWTSIDPSHNPHAYIGIVSIGLCFIQPFMALLRCKPTDSRRSIFNIAHWFVGNAAQILGLTAIFYGLELYGLPRWTWWLMIVFVGFHAIMHILFSIGECISNSRSANQVSSRDFNSSREMLQSKEGLLDAPLATFRKAMLGFYLLIVWLIVAALIAVIVIDEETLEEWGVKFWD